MLKRFASAILIRVLPLAALMVVVGQVSRGASAADAPAQDRAAERAADGFRRRDSDNNQLLSLDELLANQPENELPRLRQQFVVLDFSGDRQLSWDEYRASPGRLAIETRGTIPDPIADLKQNALEKWQALFAAADDDGDVALSAEEWPGEKIARSIPALAEVTFPMWDRDGDGRVGSAEGVWLFDLAYGQVRPNGRPLRTQAGAVLDWSYLRGLDSDHDEFVSRDEFVPRFYKGPEKSAEIFSKQDANGDGRLSVEEVEPLFWSDVLGNFFGVDTDFDGYLTQDELTKSVGSWSGAVAGRTVAAFDADGDGQLSFAEYRTTTFTNLSSNWHRRRADTDNDGRLSCQEFYLETPPFLVGLNRHFFEHFDLDKDGFLSFDEQEFNVDFRKFSPEAAFRMNDHDGDGSIVESELASRTGRPLAEVKRDMLLFDRDADGRLDEGEFSTMPTMVGLMQRGKLPDPFVKLAERYVLLFDKHWNDWDADANGELSAAEFRGGLVDSLDLPAAVNQTRADLDNDGVITRDEARGMIEMLVGLRRGHSLHSSSGRQVFAGGAGLVRAGQTPVDDQPLRLAGGVVANLDFFQRLDRNRSGTLEAGEFQNLGVYGADPTTLFARADVDHDDQLSLEEWCSQVPYGALDPVNDFRYLDTSLDGLLDRDELRKEARYKLKMVEHILPGFDFDGDGKLSLTEFRFTPLANPLANWYQDIRDDDGKLTFDEFFSAEPFALLRWHYFERFDLNADGVLSGDEFGFRVRIPNAIYTLNADGTGWARLFELEGYVKCGSPMVSPDGKTIAFDAWRVLAGGQKGPATVFAVDIDGAGCQELCQGQMPSWSPDGKFFACSRVEGGYGIAIMTAEGRQHRRISDAWSAQWSPDGKKIACYQGNKLMVYDVETNESRDVLGAANRYQQIYWNMCWSPDSRQICFKAGRPDGKFDLVLVDAGGAEQGIKVRYSASPFNPKFAWHPSENRIVFPMRSPERGLVQLYQLDPTTDEAPALVPGQDPESDNGEPCWTPDGRRLILVRGSY